MSRLRLFVFGLLVLAPSVLGGCAGTKDAASTAATTRTYTYDAPLYRVEVEERLHEDGTCRRRVVVFTAHEERTQKRRVDQARAVDRKCDAASVRGFDQFEIKRSPAQRERYAYIARYRRRVDDGLWLAYQAALQHDERRTDGS